jgi:glycosyltransferase involved in cell wall biosynthesis
LAGQKSSGIDTPAKLEVMKILMILENSLPDIRVENEIYSLNKAGHHVILVHRDKDKFPMPKWIYKSSIAALKLPFYFNWWREALKPVLAKQKFDAVHVHDLPLAKIGYEISQKYHIPFILDLHENYPALLENSLHTKTILGRLLCSIRQWKNYERKYVGLASQVITICQESANRLDIEYGRYSHIVQNTINLDTVPRIVYKPAPIKVILRLFYGGGINKHRGLQVVIEAMQILQQRNIFIQFEIIGEGSYKKNLINLVASKGIIGIHFHGQKLFPDFMKILSESNIAIIPHLMNDNNNASSPHKLFQYMYSKVPVICSDCDSLARIIQECNCGFIYQNDSIEQLAALLIFIDENRQLLARGINGQKAVIDKYNWENDSKELLKIYENA